MRQAAVDLNHGQPGDPDKLAKVLVGFAEAPNPPVRLPLGSDTVAAIEAKHAAGAGGPHDLLAGGLDVRRQFARGQDLSTL